MKLMKLFCLLLFTFAVTAMARFSYVTNRGTITGFDYYTGSGAISIPSTVNGFPVTSIGESAFGYCDKLNAVSIPNSVTNIGGKRKAACDKAFLKDLLAECAKHPDTSCPWAAAEYYKAVSNFGPSAFDNAQLAKCPKPPKPICDPTDGGMIPKIG